MLKEKNREHQEKIKLQNNQLLQECLQALGNTVYILAENEKNLVYSKFSEKIPFSLFGIEWNKVTNTRNIKNSNELLESCKNNQFYVIWSKDFPIIKSDLNLIIKNVDDIVAVEADTWLFSINYDEIVEFNHDGNIVIGEL